MKVITLTGQDFNKTCGNLANQVLKSFSPNIVIGVLTGGGFVGREMFKTIQLAKPLCAYAEVKLQRGSTVAKEKSKVKIFLKKLPVWMLNILRVLEVDLLEIKAKFVKPSRFGSIQLDPKIVKVLMGGGNNILIVDDCIDTGYTLKIIKEYLTNTFPNNEVRIAVVTTAHRHPVIEADFQLYRRVLVRFSWASDYKVM